MLVPSLVIYNIHVKGKTKAVAFQYSQLDDVWFQRCLWLVMKCGSSFSLLVEMADQRPGARQGCQSSLSKSCHSVWRGGEKKDKDKS